MRTEGGRRREARAIESKAKWNRKSEYGELREKVRALQHVYVFRKQSLGM